MIQGSTEWINARVGKITGSRAKDVGGAARATNEYFWELVCERITMKPAETFTGNYATEHGAHWEGTARAEYQWKTGYNVASFGFVDHPTLQWVGCSTDGVLADEPGIIEIKCPYKSREHIKTVHSGTYPPKYLPQLQFNLWVTGREWCDFISYDPRMPDETGLGLFVVRVPRDEAYIEALAAKVETLTNKVNEAVEKLCNGEKYRLVG